VKTTNIKKPIVNNSKLPSLKPIKVKRILLKPQQDQLTHESLNKLNLPTLKKRPQPILVSEGQSSYGGHDFSQKMLH
jgi:hypothetical protein